MVSQIPLFPFFTLALFLAGACDTEHATQDEITITETTTLVDPLATTLAPDLDPSPNAVEIVLDARTAKIAISPGQVVSLWTYNGHFPGPRIEAHVGDTVRVHLKNSLPEPTTIHWHGLRIPAAMDGVPAVQTPVQPGAEFTYEFVVKDAGTFWYHPHVRSDEQVERGLYGAFIVRGNAEPNTTTDRTVLLDDILLESTGKLAPFSPTDAMMGRQGDLILANGQILPLITLERGGLHRFRFINAANARYFRLALPGYQFIHIGTDGGFLTAPRTVDELLLVPGERTDVVVNASGEPGETAMWKSLTYDRGHGTGAQPDVNIFQIEHGKGKPVTTPILPSTLASIAELPTPPILRELRLEETDPSTGSGPNEHSQHGAQHASTDSGTAPVFAINGETYPRATPLAATLGSVEEWSVVNTTNMDHPFHLHGFRFQVMSIDGVVPGFSAWRDTVNVPAQKTLTFRVRLEDNPGTWMFHCHILEHAELGMMGELMVTRP